MPSSPPASPQQEHQDHQGDAHREATEMGQYGQALHGSSVDIDHTAHSSNVTPNWAYCDFPMRRSLAKFWQRQVSVTVPHDACRDHLALERTFLGYLRTALALSIISVIIAQLYRLEHPPNPDRMFGFFNLGIPLACVCIGAAIMVFFFGAYRFWRQQNAMLRGKVHAGGWEVNAIGLIIALVILTLFVLLVAVDSRIDSPNAS